MFTGNLSNVGGHESQERVPSRRTRSCRGRLAAAWAAGLLLATVTALAAGSFAAAQARGVWAGGALSQQDALDRNVLFTFITDVADTDIYFGNDKIGRTNKEGKFTVSLPPGDYVVTAKRGDIIRTKSLTVSRRATSYKFEMGQPTPTPTPSATPTPTPTPKPTPAATPAPSGDAVIETLLDQKKTSQLKPAELDGLLTVVFQEVAAEPSNKQLQARAQFARGQVELLRRNYAEAEQAFGTALSFARDYALPHYGLGNLYLARGKFDLAVREFKAATDVDKKFTLGWTALAQAYEAQGNRSKAADAYARGAQLGSGTPEAGAGTDSGLEAARSLIRAKHWREAEAALLRLKNSANPSSEVFLLLGDVYAGMKNHDLDAFDSYTEATQRAPVSPRAFYKLGELRFRDGNYEAAWGNLQCALELDPNGLVIDVPKARDMIAEALKKAPRLAGQTKKPCLSSQPTGR
jgi:tetratricopeptide (TPR) repeat protein